MLLIEIPIVQPQFKRFLARGPLRIDHGVPGRVSVPPLVDLMLPKGPLVHKPIPLRRLPRRQIQGVGLPLQPPMIQREEQTGEKIDRFRAGAGPLHGGTKEEAHLGDAVGEAALGVAKG